MGEKTVMVGGGLICTFASVSLHTMLLCFSIFSRSEVVDVCVWMYVRNFREKVSPCQVVCQCQVSVLSECNA